MNVGFEGIGRTVATFACKAGEEDTLAEACIRRISM